MIGLLLALTLTVTPSAPVHGDAVTFHATFPQAAFKQARQPQTPGNPALALTCGNSEGQVYREFWSGIWTRTSKNSDGTWNAVSAPIVLDSPAWPDDAQGVSCAASAGWWSWVHGVLTWNAAGSTSFVVG